MKNTFSILIILSIQASVLGQISNFEKSILGTWEVSDYRGENIIYTRIKSLKNNESGISFLENGKLIKRQNSGWCGTPPISYKNFDGTWKFETQDKLIVTYDYWGGTIEETWTINTITKDLMTIQRIDFVDSRNKNWAE